MIGLLLLLLVGMMLSAFFSGTETGFYRVSRVRLVLDGLDGDLVARGLLWLTNNPTLFVATALVGNNLANFLVSLSIVLSTEQMVHGDALVAQIIAPMILAPLVFVYGELIPKNLFYHAPNKLLRRSAPFFFLCGFLFAPLVALLWVFGRLLRRLLGESPTRLRLLLARRELAQVLEEGHHAGILRPAQRDLAQGLFSVANQPVGRFATPAARVVSVRLGSKTAEVLRLAKRHRVAAIPVTEAGSARTGEGSQHWIGYVRVVELNLDQRERVDHPRPLLQIRDTETHLAALMRMQSEREMLAQVVTANGQTVGLLTAQRLTEQLFRA